MKLYYWVLLLLPLIPVTAFSQRVYPYSYHGKYGLIDAFHQVVLEPRYKHIELFPMPSDNPYTVFSEYDKTGEIRLLYGILDNKGKEVVPARFTKLEYDGNKKYAFSLTPFNTIEVIDIKTGKGIHKQTSSHYFSKEGLVVIKALESDTNTMIFRDHTTRKHKGYVSIAPVHDSYFYECSDGSSLIYYDIDGNTANVISDDRSAEFVDANDYYTMNKKEEQWNALKEKYGEAALTRVLDDIQQSFDCVIYKHTANDTYKLLDSKGDVLFEDDNISAMSALSSYSIKFRKGDYWGVVDYEGKLSFNPEFKNIYLISKMFNYFWMDHKSGYSGVGISSGKVLLPRESGYYK